MRIFISATSQDLREFRKSVSDEIESVSGRAFSQERLSASYQSLMDRLTNAIRECDAVICLVGNTYGSAPAEDREHRSWTQIEYDVARQLEKSVLVLFPSDNCAVSEIEEGIEAKRLQHEYREKLKRSGYLYYEFDNEEQLRLRVSELMHNLRERESRPALAQKLERHYPTPYARLFKKYFDKSETLLLRQFIERTLRLTALIALQDSVVQGIFGGGTSAEGTEAVARNLSESRRKLNWHDVLRLACPDRTHGAADRFVRELPGWYRSYSDRIFKLERAAGRLDELEDQPAIDRWVADTRDNLASLLDGLQFLEHYVLVTTTNVKPAGEGASCDARVLRGEHPKSLELSGNDPDLPIEEDGLYLLSLDRVTALRLGPALWYFSAWNTDDVCGWSQLLLNEDAKPDALKLESFCDGTRVVVPQQDSAADAAVDDVRVAEPQRLDLLLVSWLGEQLASGALGIQGPAQPICWSGKVFDDESWETLKKKILPEQQVDVVLAKGVATNGPPVHPGKLVDRFEVVIDKKEFDGAPPPRHPLVHVLRQELAEPDLTREWFARRAGCWQRIRHDAVVRLHPASHPDSRKRPFLLTERVPGARSLEAALVPHAAMPDDRVRDVLRIAAEVCSAAHGQGVRVMALPLRHLLEDESGKLRLTGFDAALSEMDDGLPWLDLKLHAGYFRMFTKDADIIAPEVSRSREFPSPAADVFALGTLLARLRGLPTEPMRHLPLADWRDRWKCLAFHCLAVEPEVRFQTPAQFVQFLESWTNADLPVSSDMIEIPAGATASPSGSRQPAHVGRYFICRHLVTNAEYFQFCCETGRPYPLHQRYSLRDDNETVRKLRRDHLRLNGPWCPVTFVSLEDGEAYCRWLNERGGSRCWRLPTESEWQRAAVLNEGCPYPWGSENPTALRANYGEFWRGPTVVGSFAEGNSRGGCWDMAGNVWEWCHGPEGHPQKGGAYDFGPRSLEVSVRKTELFRETSPHVGFRVVCEE